MVKIRVNNSNVFNIDITEKQLMVDGVKLQLDVSELNSGFWSVIYNNKSYSAELVDIDRIEKSCKIKVSGHLYYLNIEDKFDQLLRQLGMDNLAANKVAEVKAPMPGLVLALKIKENDEVAKGDSLLVLEAMKMENVLKSPVDGVIKKVMVEEGSKVEKNQVLLTFK
ncbi:biotin carboxyl carrier protein [Pedobacter sp. UYP30]|uniref:biotin/lipoyl-containing protein n=1 Tax=Pedobacter sp. UYP30 TaxID=1756400 RepID=UPI00339B4826